MRALDCVVAWLLAMTFIAQTSAFPLRESASWPGMERIRVLRLDPHPAWDRTWRYVTFNAVAGGTRRVFVADMARLLE